MTVNEKLTGARSLMTYLSSATSKIKAKEGLL
jgi:hypothetical protein